MNASRPKQLIHPSQGKVQRYRPRAEHHAVRRGGAFGLWLAEQGYSPRTITLYTQTIRRVSLYLDSIDSTLARAGEAELHGFWEKVPATRSSRAGARYALIAYYKFRGREDGWPANRLLLPPAPYRLPRPFSAEVLTDLLAAARLIGGVHQLVAEMLAYTACRRCEVRTAAWHQFDLDATNPVWYIAGKGAQRRGPKPRQVPLHPSLLTTLRAWRAADPHATVLFPSTRSRDGCLSTTTIGAITDAVCAAAGVERATPHRWRHATATIALAQTMDLRAVQEFLGHASLASTQIYTGVLPGRLVEVVHALPD